MGMTTITAGRIYQGQGKQQGGEENSLSFDKFPVTGLSKVRKDGVRSVRATSRTNS